MPLRLPLSLVRFRRPSHHQCRPKYTSSQPSPTPPTPSQARITNLLRRLPKPLHSYVSVLRNAPGTHISSFLILHELTAIIPLIVLGAGFHYSGWLPGGLDEEKVLGYMNRFGSYFSKKGWFGVSASPTSFALPGEVESRESEAVHKVLDHDEEDKIITEGRYGSGTRVVLEVATAYAITKVLLPVRILGSVWATPWFARTVLSAFSWFRR